MPLTPQDVQNKRFTVVRFKPGYDEDEVDNFLDEIEEELRRLIGENSSLRQAAAAATQTRPQGPTPAPPPAAPAPAPPPPPPPVPVPVPVAAAVDEPDAALRTLMMAQKTAEEAIAQANTEAESIVHSARLKAAALEHEAQAAHNNRLASLEDERKDLEAEITALRGFEREFRTRLRAYLQSSIADLDARPSVEPAAPARPAPRPDAGPPAPGHAGGAGHPAPTGHPGPAGHPGAPGQPGAPQSVPPAFGAGPPPVPATAAPAAPRPPAPAGPPA
ncbi:MAG TPA: DivIVA domain-containing protein, partial [Mycobacteriales bacterium]|nr:DivIVA domain-containing protein [Mycobacteriales bacterium]